MISGSPMKQMTTTLVLALAALALACKSHHSTSPDPVAPAPCDLYASGGTPCVAAHSTVRALYAKYTGNLYQVRRASDSTTKDIGLLGPGGYADSAAQDSFCAGTTCVITILYDQSGRGNHLTQAPPGGFNGPEPGGYDRLADAAAAPIVVNGNKVYGVYVVPGTGYRNNAATGVAKGDEPEGMYAIINGRHYNDQCCFDYGNGETNSQDTGNGHMEAIYFGNNTVWGYGTGKGPWVMGDLENGMFSGVNAGYNDNDPPVTFRYVTAIVKGEPHHWAIRVGDGQTGSLSTYYDGARPNVTGYDPMSKEGAILLGTGGDNSNGAAGTFYEGAMTTGYPSDATEDAIQANVVAANYGKSAATCTSAPPVPKDLRATLASSYQVDLSWSAVTPPPTCWVTYDVFRNGTRVATELTGTSYSDAGLTPSTAYQYSVQAVDSVAPSASSAAVDITTSAAGPLSVNVGGPAVGSFIPDAYFTGGLTYTNTATVTPPDGVPAEIFNTERYGSPSDAERSFTYTFEGYTPGSEWTVTLYFAETYLTAAGLRRFEVLLNGKTVLAEFDLIAAGGARNLGFSRAFPVTVGSDGKIALLFTKGSIENPKVNAIGITAGLPPPDTQAPTAPGTPVADSVTSASVALSWAASTDDVGVVGYDVYSGTTLAGSSKTSSATISGLAPGTGYTFTVKAKDAAGNVSPPSAELTVSTAP